MCICISRTDIMAEKHLTDELDEDGTIVDQHPLPMNLDVH